MSVAKVLRETLSVCPVCRKRVEAKQVQRGGMVFLEKTCSEHGFFSTVIWRGYQDMELWRKSAATLSLSEEDDCPNACGLCSYHQSGTCCVLLEITKRCNLRCPYCFADGGDGGDRPFSDIIADIKALAIKGQTLLQLSGGEPTVRNDLPDIVREAKKAGCRYVQLNSNGVRLAEDLSYVQALKEAGLSFVFMQFDGVDDVVYQALRGRALLEIKKRAIENCGRLRIGVTLVPTVVPGVNDHQIGDILRFAASQSPNVRGVHFQPVSYFGRTPEAPTDKMRYTLDQLMHDIGKQAADLLPEDSLHPSRCDHPLCGFHGDYLVKPDGTLYPLLQQEERDVQATAEQNRAFVARRWDRSRSAPGGRNSEAEVTAMRDDWQAQSADRVRSADGRSRSAPGGTGSECAQWATKRAEGSASKEVCQAVAKADDHCEQRKNSEAEVTAMRDDWQAQSADRVRSADGRSRSAPGGTGSECAQWATKRAEGSVSKEVCQAVAKADDHCEQRKNSEAEVTAMRDDWQAQSADRVRSADGRSQSAPGGTGSECGQWATKRAEGSASKEVCHAVAKADDHCEQRKNSEADGRSRSAFGEEAQSELWCYGGELKQSPVGANSCCCEDAVLAYARDVEKAQTVCCCCENTAKAYVCPEDAEPANPIDLSDMDVFLQRVRTHGFTVTAMAFQDAGNLDLERLKRCSLHVCRDRRFVPFCRYYL